MRKLIAVLLTAVTLGIGAPIVGVAQSRTSTLRGQVVDAGGRGATGMRVEIVNNGSVVTTTMSTTDGYFSVAGLPVGDYVVRTYVNGQPLGVRASVAAGETGSALLVLPSLAQAAPAVVVAALGPALGALTAATVTVVGNTIVIQAAKQDDEEVLQNLVQVANQYIAELNSQLPPPPAGTPPPFQFIPTAPLS